MSDPVDDSEEDPDFDINSTPKRRKLVRQRESDTTISSDEELLSSPMMKKNRWTTPEKTELYKKLPKTVLGLERAGRGKITEVWENSRNIKKTLVKDFKNRSKQILYTKKLVPSPIKRELMKKIKQNKETISSP